MGRKQERSNINCRYLKGNLQKGVKDMATFSGGFRPGINAVEKRIKTTTKKGGLGKSSSKKSSSKKSSQYVKTSKPGAYNSALHDKIASARKELMNFNYDPLQDASYQALAQIYAARGEQAAQDTLGDAAALNGGYGTSYAVSAAQQARNQYNQELASLVPDLEQNAYAKAQNRYQMLVDRDNELYQRYRDRVGDYQWATGLNADMYQFNKNYKLDKANQKLSEKQFAWEKAQAKKSSSSSGGGGGGSSYYGSGGDYYDDTSAYDNYYASAAATSALQNLGRVGTTIGNTALGVFSSGNKKSKKK